MTSNYIVTKQGDEFVVGIPPYEEVCRCRYSGAAERVAYCLNEHRELALASESKRFYIDYGDVIDRETDRRLKASEVLAILNEFADLKGGA